MPLLHWLSGEEVDAADFQMENENFLTLIGNIAAIFFGVTSFQAGIDPLEMSIDSSGNGTIGGEPNQLCYINGRQCSGIDQYAFTVQGNGGSVTRNDVIYGTWNEKDSGSFTRAQRNPDGSINPSATFYYTAHDIAFTYVPGNSDGSLGPQPAGTVQIATITVAPGQAATYEITLPTLSSVIEAIVTALGSVTSVNGLAGAVTIDPGTGISVGTTPGTKTIDIINNGVWSINNLIEAVTIQGTNIGVSASGSEITLVNEGVTSLQSLTGAITFTSPNNTIDIEVNGSEITLQTSDGNVGGVTSIVANGTTYTGAVDLIAGDGSVTFSHLESEGGSGGLEIAVAYPIGAVIKRVERISSVNVPTITLPSLPVSGSTWMILGRAAATVLDYNMNLDLEGCSGGSEHNIANGPASNMSVEYAEISGNANYGDTPKLTLTFTGSGSFDNGQLLVLEAIRVS